MTDLLNILFATAGFALVVWLIALTAPARPSLLRRDPIDTGTHRPCWTEEIGRDGGLSLGRGECVNEALMEMDERAARGDFPIPKPPFGE